jgi:hypothetical protein
MTECPSKQTKSAEIASKGKQDACSLNPLNCNALRLYPAPVLFA